MPNHDITIIGGGPAGLMAAIEATQNGASVLLIEAGSRPGRKLLATGGGRCNLTHAGDIAAYLDGFDTPSARFLKPAAYLLKPADTMQYFEERGVPLVTERGGRVFPQSSRASDVLGALMDHARTVGAAISTDQPVSSVVYDNNNFTVTTQAKVYRSHAVIIATGGLSMRRTGATGDGYHFAESLGHTIVPPRPSLVPLITKETWPGTLAGLALKHVTLKVQAKRGTVNRFGEMLFTHHGIGGPITLEVSRFITDDLHDRSGPITAAIDLKPALDDNKLDARLRRDIDTHPKQSFRSLMRGLMPNALADTFITVFEFDGDCEANQVTRETRTRLRLLVKALPLTITGTEPIEAALVTRGGVKTREVNPKTMASRVCPGLYFAGEVLDVDGDCGGYNLQMCWSTGMLAGKSAAQQVQHT